MSVPTGGAIAILIPKPDEAAAGEEDAEGGQDAHRVVEEGFGATRCRCTTRQKKKEEACVGVPPSSSEPAATSRQ